MLVLDVNVVLAVHRADHPLHEEVRAWFDELLQFGSPFGVPAAVWHSFLRLVTHRRVFTVPTPRPEAFAFVEEVVAQPGHLAVAPGPRHRALLARMCEEGDATGDLVPDAVLAAIAVEHGAGIASLDRDFVRFPTVALVRPSRSS